MGRGLCSKCYQDPTIKAQYGPIVQTVRDDVVDAPQGTTDLGPFAALVDGDGDLDSGGLDQDASLDPAVPYPKERVPGSGTSGSATPPPLRGRLSRLFGKKEIPAGGILPATKEKRPKVTKPMGKRQSGADTLSDIWSGLGGLAMRTGTHAPLGRCLKYQAPVAGEMLDEALKGSIVDKMIVQPITKARGRFDLIGAVFGPPMLVLALERNPDQYEILMPLLESSIRNSLPLMVPAIKKVKEKEAKAAEVAAELFPDLAEGEDPVRYVIEMMFAGWVPSKVTDAPPPDAGAPAEPERTAA